MTTSEDQTFRDYLNRADPNTLADILRSMKLGNMLVPVKVVFAGLTAAASIDITTAASKAAATITGLDLATGEYLPAILSVTSLRVTASGTANTLGTYAITDVAGTMLSPTGNTVVGAARLSDDGKTLTFPTTVTAFTLEYIPRSAQDLTAQFPPT